MTTQIHPVASQLQALEIELNNIFLEREDAVRAALLALLSKEHLFMLSTPGAAKSMMIRYLIGALRGPNYFEIGLSKTRPTEAVLGPLDIPKFRTNGDYVLKTKGFLLEADFAMLDEVGKMSPVLGHDLLAALNERVRHEVSNGNSVHDIPLRSAFTASNEMITDESEDAAALWDRLLFRVLIDDNLSNDNFATLLTSEMTPPTTVIDFEDLKEACDVHVPAVKVSGRAIKGMVSLRNGFARDQMNPSNRRWRASMKALKANAFLEGRDEVDEEDLAVLRWVLWDTVPQIERVERLCLSAANPFVEPMMKLKDALEEIKKGVDERRSAELEQRMSYGKEAKAKMQAAADELKTLEMQAGDRTIPGVDKMRASLRELFVDAMVSMVEAEPEVADAMADKYIGKAAA